MDSLFIWYPLFFRFFFFLLYTTTFPYCRGILTIAITICHLPDPTSGQPSFWIDWLSVRWIFSPDSLNDSLLDSLARFALGSLDSLTDSLTRFPHWIRSPILSLILLLDLLAHSLVDSLADSLANSLADSLAHSLAEFTR